MTRDPLSLIPTLDDLLDWATHKPQTHVVGFAGSEESCPLANYLSEKEPDLHWYVNESIIQWTYDPGTASEKTLESPIPWYLGSVVRLVDNFPDTFPGTQYIQAAQFIQILQTVQRAWEKKPEEEHPDAE